MSIIIAIFFILHGLVHFLYFGQSTRFFELQPGLTWPDNAWLFAPFFTKKAVRILASNFCILAGIGFVISGFTVFLHHTNWYLLAGACAIFSSFIFLVFWNGKFEKIHDQGAVAVLINGILLLSITVFQWPQFNF